jgi:hypothetical protein
MREVVHRAGMGWVNTYNERELQRLFERRDFYWENQVIWKIDIIRNNGFEFHSKVWSRNVVLKLWRPHAISIA